MPPAAGLREEMAAYNRAALAWFEQHIRIGMERGNIAPGTDPASTAVVLLGAMRGVMQQWLWWTTASSWRQCATACCTSPGRCCGGSERSGFCGFSACVGGKIGYRSLWNMYS